MLWLQMKNSRWYIINGVLMLVTFPVFRILSVAYAALLYSQQSNFPSIIMVRTFMSKEGKSCNFYGFTTLGVLVYSASLESHMGDCRHSANLLVYAHVQRSPQNVLSATKIRKVNQRRAANTHPLWSHGRWQGKADLSISRNNVISILNVTYLVNVCF